MSICVYALVPAHTRVKEDGLRLVTSGSIAAVVADRRRPPVVSRHSLRAYDRTMQTLARSATSIVPVRFNTCFDSEASLVAVLRSREGRVKRILAHLRNRVQMTVRIPSRQVPMLRDVSSGQAYLRSRARAQQVPDFELLRPAVATWVRDERIEWRGRLASVYHLIPRSSTARYHQALQTAAVARGTPVLISGPFPPYAFAGYWL